MPRPKPAPHASHPPHPRRSSGGAYVRAVELLDAAARLEYLPAFAPLARCFSEGRGAIESEAVALQWLREGAKRKDAACLLLLGELYRDGKLIEARPGPPICPSSSLHSIPPMPGHPPNTERTPPDPTHTLPTPYPQMDPDYAKAYEYFRRAADAGSLTAVCRMADLFLHGQGLPLDKAQAERCGRMDGRISAGVSTDTQRTRSGHGRTGSGPNVNADGAFLPVRRLYRAVAEAGNAEAQNKLAVLILADGERIRAEPADGAFAVEMLRRAMAKRDPLALAAMTPLEQGENEAPEEAEAAAEAANNFAICLEEGVAVERDYTAARGLFQVAVAQGSVAATNNLAAMLVRRKQFVEAARHFRDAAAKGHSGALAGLALLLEARPNSSAPPLAPAPRSHPHTTRPLTHNQPNNYSQLFPPQLSPAAPQNNRSTARAVPRTPRPRSSSTNRPSRPGSARRAARSSASRRRAAPRSAARRASRVLTSCSRGSARRAGPRGCARGPGGARAARGPGGGSSRICGRSGGGTGSGLGGKGSSWI